MKTVRVLVVDDDPAIRKFIRANLEARGYQVFLAADGEDGINIIEAELPDLVLLDIMMPKVDGLEVCRRVRTWSDIPIIVLSAREGEMDKVKCLDCGADDYLTKPFSLRELLARVKAVLRRTHENADNIIQSKYCHGDLEVDLGKNRVMLEGKDITLTKTEFKILTYLVANAGRVITADQILSRIWGEDYIGDNHVVQVFIARLRKRLKDTSKEAKYIETRSGIGYFIRPAEEPIQTSLQPAGIL
jgi:DNA-binding response OmpR family regulator